MPHEEYEILIVEDNPHDAELMLRSLQKNHLANNIIVLEDGEKALDFIFCRESFAHRDMLMPPKVIFLDLKLPKLNGLEVLKEIKEDPNTKKIPVVIITSSREDPDIHTAYELGANSYVVKPVDFSDFMETMTDLGSYWIAVNEGFR